MITYVRVRTVKGGKYQAAIEFSRRYKDFVQSTLGAEISFGAEVGRLGTVVSIAQFENAQAWEDALNALRSNPEYVQLLDESFKYFEDEVVEHLITELPI
jgi:hypothetical protein